MGVPIKYHNGTDWVLIDAGAIVDSNGNRITADNITNHTTDSGIHITSAERTSWNGKINTSEKGVANGVTPLDANGIVPDAYIKKGLVNGVATLDSSGNPVQKPFVTGTFSGDGTASRFINLGFTPTGIFIFPTNNILDGDNGGTSKSNGGFAVMGYPFRTALYCTVGGFYTGQLANVFLNQTGVTYGYIAFK